MFWINLSSFFMLLAVALGAFGAHAMKGHYSDYAMEIYKTAVFYHIVHALGLFIVAWLNTLITDPKIMWAGILFIAGIVLFSGSLYLLAFTGASWLGAITPLGGLSFLIGWGLLIFVR